MKFNVFISESININNGIGQSNPLSMLLYIIYNADLLEILDNEELEDAIGYVDDVALLVTGTDFEETSQKLCYLMEKQDGALDWSLQ